MEVVLRLTYYYLIVLLLSLLVERIMEIITETWNFIEWKMRLYRFWNGKVNNLRSKYETKAKSQILYRIIDLTPITRQIRHATLSEKKGHSQYVTIISGEVIRQTFMSTGVRLTATFFGVVFCFLTGINLVKMFEQDLPGFLITWPSWVQLVISGVVVGLGSEPVHSMIKNFEKRRADKTQDVQLKKRLGIQPK